MHRIFFPFHVFLHWLSNQVLKSLAPAIIGFFIWLGTYWPPTQVWDCLQWRASLLAVQQPATVLLCLLLSDHSDSSEFLSVMPSPSTFASISPPFEKRKKNPEMIFLSNRHDPFVSHNVVFSLRAHSLVFTYSVFKGLFSVWSSHEHWNPKNQWVKLPKEWTVSLSRKYFRNFVVAFL